MKIKALWVVLCAIAFYACDDQTSTLGFEASPDADNITISNENFDVTTKTLAAGDSVLARTSKSYLGNYTDPETGTTIHSDFLSQFHCLENFSFPDSVQNNVSYRTDLRLFFDDFIGDSLAPCRVSVYPLTKSLDNSKNYYTNIDPTEYYDESAGPIASTTFTVSDRTLSDSARYDGDSYRHIRLQIPTSIGTDIIKKYKSHPEYFANADAFEKNVCKGYYIKFDKGDGVMMDIYVSQLNVYFNYLTESSSGVCDSLVSGVSTFSATEEVIQATKVQNKNLDKLLNDNEATYLKTPCGLFTEVTLPIEQITNNDTINSAKLVLNGYNIENNTTKYQLSAPSTLLMVRKKDMYSFFEKNQIADNVTSYLASYVSSGNTYTYSNIARLISTIRSEKPANVTAATWLAANPDWNKVVLIPVTATYNTSSTLVAIDHDLSLTSLKLKNSDVKLQLIFSKFNNN